MNFVIDFFKMFVLCNLTFYTYFKIIGSKEITISKVIVNALVSIATAVIYSATNLIFDSLIVILMCVLLHGLISSYYIDKNNKRYWIAYIFSFFVSYVIYMISVFATSIIMLLISNNKTAYSPACLIFIALFSLIISFAIFKFPKFKNGVNFIKNFTYYSNSTVFVLVAAFGVILMLYVVFQSDFTQSLLRIAPFAVVIVSMIFIFIIYNQISKHYRSNMRDRTISVQKEEIDANEKEISELKEQNLKLAKTIHKYNHRLSSLENSIRKVIDNSNVEFASELSIVLEQTKKVGEQLSDETKVTMKLPTTNVLSVDNMLDYMKEEATKCGIDFALKVSDSVKILIDKYIAEDKFETLLGDHIKDAIIAINSKGDGYKSILVLIGIVDGAYELSIYDTGVEFDIPTLLKLGTEPITTHKNDGGSGLGFMTTFETLKSCKASLVIEEYDAAVTNYTKSVTIRFDGKCEYRIYSYRADKIKSESNNRKIIIKSI